MTKRFSFPLQTVKIGNCRAALLPIHGVWTQPDYVFVRYEGKQWRGHILSYKLNNGKLTQLTLHTCDHKWCIEPSHLYQGGRRENMMDHLKLHRKEYSEKISKTQKQLCANPKRRAFMSEIGKKRLSNPKHRAAHINRMRTQNPMQLMSEKDKKKFFANRKKRTAK